MTSLYERIFEMTQKLNISGKELGQMLGLKKSPLTDWKNKKSNPTLEQLIKMCEIFATSIEWLITGKEAKDLTPDEKQLVDCYRMSNDTGKEIILENAITTSRKLPAELTSSTSGIG